MSACSAVPVDIFDLRFKAMFAVVRTGGKQYRIAADQKIIVDRLPGEAGDTVTLGDVLLMGEAGDLKAGAGQTVTAEIVAQTKGDKVIVFKKKRRHNYRRKNGHRQDHTVLKIVAIGGEASKKAAKPKAEAAPVATAPVAAETAPAVETAPAKAAKPKAPKAEAASSVATDAAPAAVKKTAKPKAAKADPAATPSVAADAAPAVQ
jgi:large subunit ribosomal protein L21